MRPKWKKLRVGALPLTRVGRISRKLENFIIQNDLYLSHNIYERGKSIEIIDHYPVMYYKKLKEDNCFCLKIRMDGCFKVEKLRECERELADLFSTICVDRIEERGYLTYCFELEEPKQEIINSREDILKVGKNEIALTREICWNWRQCPHLLLVGNTGSGKTFLTQYIASCLEDQGVRVIYIDPKKDDDMRLFMLGHPAIKYVTDEKEISKVIRETEEEVRAREKELTKIGLEEIEFIPIFLLFDELIAFSKIADKKTYDDTENRLSSIVVTGRSKGVYAGMILQRPDTTFIEGVVRDNLGCKIAMGNMSETAYKMAFGNEFSKIKNVRREKGSGLIYRQGVDTVPREFVAPYIEKGALNRV